MNTKVSKPTGADDSANATNGITSSAKADEAKSAASVNVAYHDGPPFIGYFGSRWERGKAKEVSADDWAAMQLRGDFAPFDFRVV